jgi:hypothetical protein
MTGGGSSAVTGGGSDFERKLRRGKHDMADLNLTGQAVSAVREI